MKLKILEMVMGLGCFYLICFVFIGAMILYLSTQKFPCFFSPNLLWFPCDILLMVFLELVVDFVCCFCLW